MVELNISNKIINKTVELFLVKGKLALTTEEITNELDINRTAIHYYFRTKSNLLTIVYKKIVDDILLPMYEELFTEGDFIVRIHKFINLKTELLREYPYLEFYMIYQYNFNEINREYIQSLQQKIISLIHEKKASNQKIKFDEMGLFFEVLSRNHI